MKRGRYNIELPNKEIKKFNVYVNDYGNLFIYFDKNYIRIQKKERYRGGWLYRLKPKKKAIWKTQRYFESKE